jgi:VCBS repeat-containing protein
MKQERKRSERTNWLVSLVGILCVLCGPSNSWAAPADQNFEAVSATEGGNNTTAYTVSGVTYTVNGPATVETYDAASYWGVTFSGHTGKAVIGNYNGGMNTSITFFRFGASDLANDFKLNSLAALANEMQSSYVYAVKYRVEGFNGGPSGTLVVSVAEIDLRTSGTYGSGAAAISYARTGAFGGDAGNGGILTFGNAWDNIDTVVFTVTDGRAAQLSLDSLDFSPATPVNTPPTVNANTGLTLNEGAIGSITASRLDFNDAEQADSAITYTVTALPVNGQLLLNGVAVTLNGTFTQANLNSGALRYSHNGSDTASDSFAFTVNDGAGGSVMGQIFSFTIAAVNDATTLATTPTITFTTGPGSSSALDGLGGSTDVNGIALEVYFANSGLSRINSTLTFEDPYSAGAANSGLAVNYASSAGSHYVIIKSRTTGDNFWLQSLQLTDYGGNNVKIEAFDNGVSRGSVNVTVNADPWYFTFDQNGALTPAIFSYADEIRISGQNAGIIWLTINDIRIAAPTVPNTSPIFVGATTTLEVSQNSSANDIKSLLHVNDPDGGQTLTWSQNIAPTHGSLSFISATAASGSSDLTPGGTITYTPTAGYVGPDSFTVQVSDGTASATRTITVTVSDTTAPAITSVSVPANATYVAGQNLDFTVNLSEAVTVDTTGGTPFLGLTVGAAFRNTTYVSGSGTTALLFRYTVQLGDEDADGIAIAAILSLSGGTMRDAANNDTGLSFVAPNTAGILVDTTAPVITSGSANGTYGASFANAIVATGSPTSFGASGLPDGLSLNTVTGDISGTPTANGTFNVVMTATDAAGNVGSVTNTFIIAKATLTATAENKSRYFYQPNPSFTGSLSGNVLSDNLSVAFSTSATPSSPAGDYDIAPAVNDPNGRLGNYNITLLNGTLTITVAAPALQLATNSVHYTIGQSPAILLPGAEFSAPSSPSFQGGQLTVTTVSNLGALDLLSVATNELLTATTTDVSYNGNMFATYSGGATGATALQFTFGASADSTSMQSLLTNLTFAVGFPRNVTNFTRLLQFDFSDGNGLTSAPVLLTVILNHAPRLNSDRVSTGTNLPASITFARLFQNDSDTDGDALTLVHVDAVSQQGGTVVSNATGVVYTPPVDFVGLDRFTYTMTDDRSGVAAGEVQMHVLLPDQISLEIAPLEWGINQPACIGAMGIPGMSYRLQATEDFSGWTTLETQIAPVDGFMRFFDQDSTNYMHRFYRGVSP